MNYFQSYSLSPDETIVAAWDKTTTGSDIDNDYGSVTADNFNLFGANGDAGVIGFTPGPTDIVPASGVTVKKILSPLANNGGPTKTHALPKGSPAIDPAPVDSEYPATDQRGKPRPHGPGCDIGAFER
jgi:hypothetical protein